MLSHYLDSLGSLMDFMQIPRVFLHGSSSKDMRWLLSWPMLVKKRFVAYTLDLLLIGLTTLAGFRGCSQEGLGRWCKEILSRGTRHHLNMRASGHSSRSYAGSQARIRYRTYLPSCAGQCDL